MFMPLSWSSENSHQANSKDKLSAFRIVERRITFFCHPQAARQGEQQCLNKDKIDNSCDLSHVPRAVLRIKNIFATFQGAESACPSSMVMTLLASENRVLHFFFISMQRRRRVLKISNSGANCWSFPEDFVIFSWPTLPAILHADRSEDHSAVPWTRLPTG